MLYICVMSLMCYQQYNNIKSILVLSIELLGCPRSPYSLQLGPRVLMYNILEIEIVFLYILYPNYFVLYWQTVAILFLNIFFIIIVILIITITVTVIAARITP